jgi:hypothetical protein
MRSELVRSRNPFYDERHAPFEDFHVCFEALRTWNFGFVHQVLTYSRRDNESILSRIRPFQFDLFSRYAAIVLHGRNFLSEEEYRRCLKVAEHKYFHFLGWSAVQGRDAKFWQFHRERLASVDQSLNFASLAKWILVVALDHIGNPKRTLEDIWRRRKEIFSAAFGFIGRIRRPFIRKRLSEKS